MNIQKNRHLCEGQRFQIRYSCLSVEVLNQAEVRQKTDLKIHIFFDDRLIRIS